MLELPKYYTTLFNAMTDAIEAIRRKDYGTAETVLIQGQKESEELIVSEEEKET